MYVYVQPYSETSSWPQAPQEVAQSDIGTGHSSATCRQRLFLQSHSPWQHPAAVRLSNVFLGRPVPPVKPAGLLVRPCRRQSNHEDDEDRPSDGDEWNEDDDDDDADSIGVGSPVCINLYFDFMV